MKNTAGTTTYMDLGYTYARGNSYGSANGKTGQMTKIVDNLDHNRDKLYEFDALGRIRTAKGGSAAGASWVTANWTQTYSYDRYGNKTGVSASGITQDSNAVPVDGLASLSMSTSTNRITGWDYDKTGNLVRGQDASGVWWRFEYDAAGRLKKVKDDSNNLFENYTYGAGREKLLVDDGESYSYYVWGGGSIVAEYTSKGASPKWKKSYIYAGSRLLMAATKVNATTEKHEFHHPDRLGTQLVTNGGTGTSYRQTTLPFGTALGAESTGYSNQVFTSYDRSSSTGLDYAVNRTYSKGQSRFTQVDPIGMASASIGNPQSNNLYAYTQNMPTDFVDPSGLLRISFFQICRYVNDQRVCEVRFSFFDDGGGESFTGGGGGGDDPKEVAKNKRCKDIIAKALDYVQKFLQEWKKYNPEADARGGHPMRGGGTTKPFGHAIEMRNLQNGMRNKAAEYDRWCNDRNDGRGGRGGGLPDVVRSLSKQLIPVREGPAFNFQGPSREQVRIGVENAAKAISAGTAAAAAAAAALLWILVM